MFLIFFLIFLTTYSESADQHHRLCSKSIFKRSVLTAFKNYSNFELGLAYFAQITCPYLFINVMLTKFDFNITKKKIEFSDILQ